MSGSGRALLFDIDGTLADTDALHLEAFNQVFAPHGHVFDRERASKELMGFSNTSISERFLPGRSPERQAAIMAEKEQAFRTLASGQIKPLAGLLKLLALADRADVPMVAVTNAPRLNAEMMLSGLGIMQRFKAVISATSFRTESRTRCHIWRGCAP
jgi:phosphoglycolate phosphatase